MTHLEWLRDATCRAWIEHTRQRPGGGSYPLGYYHGLRDAYLAAGGLMVDLSDLIEATPNP